MKEIISRPSAEEIKPPDRGRDYLCSENIVSIYEYTHDKDDIIIHSVRLIFKDDTLDITSALNEAQMFVLRMAILDQIEGNSSLVK